MALSANVELNNMRGHVEMHEGIMPQNGSSAGELGAGHDGVLAQHHEGADSCSPLTSPAEETLGSARAGGKKPRKNRMDKWLEKDTEQLMEAYATCQKSSGRTPDGRKEPLWDRVASELKRKTTRKWKAEECQRRVDTVIKAYKKIANYCTVNKMKVSESIQKHYEKPSSQDETPLKPLATHMTEKLFNLIRAKCPPKLETELKTEQGDGSLPSPFDPNEAATTGHRSSTGGKHALANSGARPAEAAVDHGVGDDEGSYPWSSEGRRIEMEYETYPVVDGTRDVQHDEKSWKPRRPDHAAVSAEGAVLRGG